MKNPIMVEIPEEMYKKLLEIERKYLFLLKNFKKVLGSSDNNSEKFEKVSELFENL